MHQRSKRELSHHLCPPTQERNPNTVQIQALCKCFHQSIAGLRDVNPNNKTHHQNQQKNTKFSTIFKRNTDKLYTILRHNTLWIVIRALESLWITKFSPPKQQQNNSKCTYWESPPIISSTAKSQFEPSQTIISAKGGCISATRASHSLHNSKNSWDEKPCPSHS